MLISSRAVNVIIAGVLAFGTAAAHVVQRVFVEFDPQKTKIEWTLGDVLHTVHGTFRMKQGRVNFDRKGQSISGEITVDTATGESGNGIRDRRMKKDVLETQLYPEARFVPTKIDGAIAMNGASSARVTGTLDLNGSKHEITIPVKFEFSNGEVRASASFVIPYVEWGMKNPSTLVLRVEKNVKVTVTAVGRLTFFSA